MLPIAVMRNAVSELQQAGRIGYGVWGTGVLVETLLQRGATGDLSEAEEQIEWLVDVSAGNGSTALEITLLRLRGLSARAPRRGRCFPGVGEPLSLDGEIAGLRRTYGMGRGDDRR
jgi:hypothetical protein